MATDPLAIQLDDTPEEFRDLLATIRMAFVKDQRAANHRFLRMPGEDKPGLTFPEAPTDEAKRRHHCAILRELGAQGCSLGFIGD